MASPEPAAPAPGAGRHPLVERILAGTAPDALRLGAARGALPLPAGDLAYLQVSLLKDPSPEIAGAAGESLAGLDEAALLALVADPTCDAVVLDHFLRSGRLQGAALEAAVAHPSVPDAALEEIAVKGAAAVLSLLVTNEVRIIGNPKLLDLLRGNRSLLPDDRRRLTELERDYVGKESLRLKEHPVAEPEEAEIPPVPEGEVEPGTPPVFMSPEQEKEYEEQLRKTPTFQRVMKMNVAERVQLAMKGNAEERAILVRDTAKMVALQVLRSPKLNGQEIVAYAHMRNIHEDVIRVIAGHREWTKSYHVAHALVRNPKTPPGLSVQFLARLGTRDLKIVLGDKNIPELVRRQARNLFLVRTQPPKKAFKKAH
jgi:hypothetical protein